MTEISKGGSKGAPFLRVSQRGTMATMMVGRRGRGLVLLPAPPLDPALLRFLIVPS